MDSRINRMNCDSVEVILSDSSGDSSNSNDNSDATENCTLLRSGSCNTTTNNTNNNNNYNPQQQNDVIYRRIANYAPNSKIDTDFDDDLEMYGASPQYHSSSRQPLQSKSVRRFLFIFGFASTLIILSQIYLSLYYEEPTLQGWDRNRTRSIPLYILPNSNTTLIEPTTICKENTPILLLIVVCSAADNFESRQTLRETWANTTEFNYSKFVALHSQLKGQYLPINYPEWENFTVKNENVNRSTKSSSNLNEDISFNNVETDASHANFQIRIVFLLGKTENTETQERIVNESRTHNDLIQESFYDSYNNLTIKSVMMLKWITNNCDGKVTFLMKCDDDTFVNIPNLIHFLLGGTIPVYESTLKKYNARTVHAQLPGNRLKYNDNLLVGVRFCESKPITDYTSKWFTPRYMYDQDFYPTYLSGTGYVFTMNAAVKLYNVSMNIPLFHLEDVYLTGMCAKRAKIKPIHFQLFNFASSSDMCEFRGSVTIHEIKSSDMRKAYDAVTNPNITCKPPSKRAVNSIRPYKKKKNCD